MSRLERLVNLTAALIDADRPLTREELRTRVGGYAGDPVAFRRTFERDKDLLRQMGMPVATEAVDPERPEVLGYRIHRDDYELPDPGLDDDEVAALRLATSVVRVDDEATATALRKLAAAGPEVPAGLGATAELKVDDVAATVFGAVAARQRLRFPYRGTDRLVDPWRLSYRGGQWYLSGYDHGRGDGRLYRLDRMAGQVETDGSPGAFERPAGAPSGPARAWQLGDGPEVVVDVLVDAEQARFAEEQLGETGERRPDGSARFAVPATDLAALRSWVLGLLDHAEVLGPPEVRADVVTWLEALAAGGGAGDGTGGVG